jgi:hypothetical protein
LSPEDLRKLVKSQNADDRGDHHQFKQGKTLLQFVLGQ